MVDKYRRENGQEFAVIPMNDATEFAVVNCGALESEKTSVVAVYSEKWRAENHAIAGCPCAMNWHYYHGQKHESAS